jgi:hypothetical protein
MDYKVVTKCVGFQGKKWEVGTIVDIDPSENPPKHFVPLNQVASEPQKKTEPHRTEPVEMAPGKNREVIGGMGSGLEKQKLGRIMTTDKVPNDKPKTRLRDPKKRKR